MPQKIFEPFRKLPHQFQNFSLIQKLHDFTLGRNSDAFGSYLTSTYGCLESPSAVAYDGKLGLLAVGSCKGVIKVYGTPGVVFTVRPGGPSVTCLCFLPEEGRLLSASTDGNLTVYELNTKNGMWTECATARVLSPEHGRITALTLGYGVVYVGSSTGTLFQLAVKDGRMSLGDPLLTSFTSAMVTESVPVDKRGEVAVDSPIVSLEMQPGGAHILIAYASGCVAVAIPQAIPETNGTEAPSALDVPMPATEIEGTGLEKDQPSEQPQPVDDVSDHRNGAAEPTLEGDVNPVANSEPPPPAVTVKEHSERRATLKIKEFTRSLRRLEPQKQEVEMEPSLPVPPAPRISHLLLRDQPVEWATWRVTAPETQSNEVTVAYGDGAFQVWPITTAASQELLEPIVVSKRDPPSTPYGPLPCGAIKKILQYPSVNGGVLTAFSGGLPRAEFVDRHAVSLLQDQEHHVCFQFGSEVKDFIFLPLKYSLPEEPEDVTAPETHVTGPCPPSNASALLVLTERELVVVDLQHPTWPVFPSPYLNCLNLSPVTAITHLTKVSWSVLSHLCTAAKCEQGELANSQWPIWGGENSNAGVALSHNDSNDVLVLGHANGWVTLLSIGRGDSLHRLGTFHTDSLFNLVDSPNGSKCNAIEVETWPPFRRVGDCALAHPACIDENPDPRLAVTQLVAAATADSLTIVVGGAGGQVTVWTAHGDGPAGKLMFEPDVARIHANLIDQDAENPKYIWKGPPAMRPFEGVAQIFGSALFPSALIQLDPPTPVVSLSFEPNWNLTAIGTHHGFIVVDMLSRAAIYTDFFLAKFPVAEASLKSSRPGTAMQNAIVARGKQITATMRQSFRRLKHLRTSTTSGTPVKSSEETTNEQAPLPPESPVTTEHGTTAEATSNQDVESAAQEAAEQMTDKPDSTEPVVSEAPVETRPEPIYLYPNEIGYSVRSFLFADTYLLSPIPATAQQPAIFPPRTPSLWVATATGRVMAHSLSWEDTSGPVTVQVHKELQLQHHASVIGLCILDATSKAPVLTSSRTRSGFELAPKPTTEPETNVEPKNEEGAAVEKSEEPVETATPAAVQEIHQLLLCSEEQVKLFQLPSLRALHKQKFVDRLRLPGHTGGSGTSTSTAEPTPSRPEKETVEAPAVESTGESELKPCVAPQPHRKSLTGFGVQAFVRGTVDQPRTEWNVVVTRHDGKSFVLSLPNLRRLFKVAAFVDPCAQPLPCVASLSCANFVFWCAGCQLLVTELAPVPRLSSPAFLIAGAPNTLSAHISLPSWARPHQPAVDSEEKTDEVTTAVENADASDVAVEPHPCTDGTVNGSTEVHTAEAMETAGPLTERCYSSVVPHAGDVTMDSIKEYLNGEGTVTIKTIETSSEKRTLVEGGHVVTTLHETERVDGKLIKDDILKFSSDDPSLSPTIAEVT
ncbi:hypothetical protein EG68_02537 [Paragonimus skrjabini miyazakii]|uniref:Lethal giant larvae homologue 2 domain-containing protein n=1 Tax=Paragonimus skrjabini miyazakii TaxID=59628 RepID=A0A8S9Z9P7_9TREM|nr:hypothetical protein EG68_02537 [Paragonimus skrjabini miyazakii]